MNTIVRRENVVCTGTSAATGAVAGHPGHWEPLGARPPQSQAEMDAIRATPPTWAPHDFIVAVDPTMNVPGSMTFVGGVPASYVIVEGSPAMIPSPAGWVPLDVAALNRMFVTPANAEGLPIPWAEGSYVDCADGSTAYWNGDTWLPGAAAPPIDDVVRAAAAGTPGAFYPATAPLPTAAALVNGELRVLVVPISPWPVADWVVAAGGEHLSWTGSQWVVKP